MSILLKLAAAAAIVLATSSCVVRINSAALKDKFNGAGKIRITSKGPVKEKTVSLENFSSISIEGPIDVRFFYAEEPRAEIKASESVLDYVEVIQDGQEVKIRYSKDVKVNVGNQTDIDIYSPVIAKVAVLGSGEFSADRIAQDSIDFLVSGSGDINIDELVADKADLVVTGSGDIDADRLKVGRLAIQVVGSGDIKVNGEAETLDCGVVGSGDIDISRLECSKQNTNVEGSGSIIR